MQYACHDCGSPAVTMPVHLNGNALVHCRDCRRPVATWAVFKHRTTQVILAGVNDAAEVNSLSYDPLDTGLLRARAGQR